MLASARTGQTVAKTCQTTSTAAAAAAEASQGNRCHHVFQRQSRCFDDDTVRHANTGQALLTMRKLTNFAHCCLCLSLPANRQAQAGPR